MKCRHCDYSLEQILIDLGECPPSNSYILNKKFCSKEKKFPLIVYICNKCWLVQTLDTVNRKELFSDDYSYLSSYSKTWLDHVSIYSNEIIEKLMLSKKSLVIEIASNDGSLLENFKYKNIPCFGIEPTNSSAEIALSKGIPVYKEFFSSKFAKKLSKTNKTADLIIANNVLAHVPDINDFLKGFEYILKKNGTVTFEFPYLIKMIETYQFDTIYHEHFSYLSFSTCVKILSENNLEVYDVEEISTHGGSLRIYAQRKGDEKKIKPSVYNLIKSETKLGVFTRIFYADFSYKSKIIRDKLLIFLQEVKRKNKKVIGYGAAAKGNTLLNFAKIDRNLLDYVVDKNPMKYGKLLPGSHIPIVKEEEILTDKPDYVIILPWNIKNEVMVQLNYIKSWGGKFVVFQPKMEIF